MVEPSQMCLLTDVTIWAAAWQNQQNDCAPSEDSDQYGHPPSLIRVFAVRSMGSSGPKLSSCGQWRLWSEWADAQADLSLRWAHMPFCSFCHKAAHIRFSLGTASCKSRPQSLTSSKCKKHVQLYFVKWLTNIWTSSCDYGTYHIGDQRRLRRACASAQSPRAFAIRTHAVWK